MPQVNTSAVSALTHTESQAHTQAREQLTSNKEAIGWAIMMILIFSCYCSVEH